MKANFNPNKFKKLVINIFLVFLSLFLCLLALEIILRVRAVGTPSRKIVLLREGVKTRSVGLNANSHMVINNPDGVKVQYITNADGLRDYDYSIKKGNDIFRIVGIGDSFTYGLCIPLRDTYLKVLEKRLNELTLEKYRVEIINLGVCGIGEKQMFELLKQVGMKYEPDLVLLGLYIGNDLSDNMKYVYGENIEKLEQRGSLKYPFKKFLKQHSKAIAFLAQKWSDFCFSVGINKYGKEKLFMKRYEEDIERAFNLTEELTVGINEFLKNCNVELCVIIIPMKFQVDFDLRYKGKYIEDNIVIDKPQLTIIKILDRNSIGYIDLLEILKEQREHGGQDLYFSKDLHWNSAGHHLAAEEIYRYLVANQLVPVSMKNKESKCQDFQ